MDSPRPPDPIFVKEMGISHREFFRILPKALGSSDYKGAGNRIRFGNAARYLEIEVSPEGERRIASVRLPVTRVSLVFHGYGAAEIAEALDRFDVHFRRGGG